MLDRNTVRIQIQHLLKISTSHFREWCCKNKSKTDGCWHNSTGILPRLMLMGAANDALRASMRESHNLAYVFSSTGYHACLMTWRSSLTCLAEIPFYGLQQGHGVPSSWLHADRSYLSALCCIDGLLTDFLCQGAIQDAVWKLSTQICVHLGLGIQGHSLSVWTVRRCSRNSTTTRFTALRSSPTVVASVG